MKKGLLLFLVILASASVVLAQYPEPGGAVGVYSNDTGTSCDFVDSGGLVSFYLFHSGSPGATAIEFKLDLTGFAYLSHFGDSSPFILKQGNFHDGCSIAYQACLSGTPIYLGSANYLGPGSTAACHRIYVTAHPIPSTPGATTPLMVDCQDTLVEVAGSYGIFNNDGSCSCTGSVPNEQSSWGQIKALYE